MADTNSQCEICAYFDYDDDYGGYVCTMNLDEDEMMRFLQDSHSVCPYFHIYDEYKIVRKQN